MAGGTSARYVTSIDRAGLALGAGGALAGMVAVALLIAGGQHDLGALVTGWIIGAFFAMAGIVAVAGPVWLALHLANRRGPLAASITGGAVALLLFTAGQSWGFALLDPAAPRGGTGAGIATTAATSLAVALAAAAIGWTMHRLAYRRIF